MQRPRGPFLGLLERATVDQLESWAQRLGVSDVFVLRRLAENRYAHVGGVGRGAGWAGIVELDMLVDPIGPDLAVGRPARFRWAEPHHVFGPYWACCVVALALTCDELVVFGTADRDSGLSERPDADLRACATYAAERIDDVSPAKRLADELELLHAVQDLASRRPATVAEAMEAITEVAACALSCEAAALYVPGRDLAVHERGWHPPVDLTDALGDLFGAAAEVVCTQDASSAGMPPALGADHAVRSHLIVPIGAPVKALLVAVHTRSAPRGFTDLCQQLGRRLGEVADMHLSTTFVREEMQEALRESRLSARSDPLTGLGNRLAWGEACDIAAERVAEGYGYGVVVADLDGLKACNDRYGHAAGDALIVRFAERVRTIIRTGDTAFRTGGDEVAVLLPADAADEAGAVADRLREALSDGDDQALRAAVGHAWCGAGGDIADAARAADDAMYAEKARTRGARVPVTYPLSVAVGG
jgi:diguanylate cyclase (GGDEF)-like protein